MNKTIIIIVLLLASCSNQPITGKIIAKDYCPPSTSVIYISNGSTSVPVISTTPEIYSFQVVPVVTKGFIDDVKFEVDPETWHRCKVGDCFRAEDYRCGNCVEMELRRR